MPSCYRCWAPGNRARGSEASRTPDRGTLFCGSEKGGAERVLVLPCFPGQFPRAKMIVSHVEVLSCHELSFGTRMPTLRIVVFSRNPWRILWLCSEDKELSGKLETSVPPETLPLTGYRVSGR